MSSINAPSAVTCRAPEGSLERRRSPVRESSKRMSIGDLQTNRRITEQSSPVPKQLLGPRRTHFLPKKIKKDASGVASFPADEGVTVAKSAIKQSQTRAEEKEKGFPMSRKFNVSMVAFVVVAFAISGSQLFARGGSGGHSASHGSGGHAASAGRSTGRAANNKAASGNRTGTKTANKGKTTASKNTNATSKQKTTGSKTTTAANKQKTTGSQTASTSNKQKTTGSKTASTSKKGKTGSNTQQGKMAGKKNHPSGQKWGHHGLGSQYGGGWGGGYYGDGYCADGECADTSVAVQTADYVPTTEYAPAVSYVQEAPAEYAPAVSYTQEAPAEYAPAVSYTQEAPAEYAPASYVQEAPCQTSNCVEQACDTCNSDAELFGAELFGAELCQLRM